MAGLLDYGIMQPGPTMAADRERRKSVGSRGLLEAIGAPMSFAPNPVVNAIGNGLLGARYLTGEADPTEGAKSLSDMTAMAVGSRLPAPIRNIITYHGSPHKFDKFDSSKIGTGEGAQAYGHGLYLAESDGVAKSYARGVLTTKNIVEENGKWLIRDDVNGILAGPFDKKSDAIIRLQSVGAQNANLYKVDLPDSAVAKMLDWDKPLSQQAPEVQSAVASFKRANIPPEGLDMGGGGRIVSNAGGRVKPNSSSPWVLKTGDKLFDISQSDVDRMLLSDKGEAAYTRMTALLGGQDKATEALRSAGIPGIRYLDGGSRGTGQGTSNFVVFPGEEGLLKILERNGVGLIK